MAGLSKAGKRLCAIAYLPNARGFAKSDLARAAERTRKDIALLKALPLDVRSLRDGEALLAAHEAPLELAGSPIGGG